MEAPLPADSHPVPPTAPLTNGTSEPSDVHRSRASSGLEELAPRIEAMLDYRFRDHDLLKEALTHASIADNRRTSNERLEFLGDSVLGLVICHRLFEIFPDYLEGDLTKL